MERVLQLGAMLALAWMGQALLGSQPALGAALLIGALTTFVWLPRLAEQAKRALAVGQNAESRSPAAPAPARVAGALALIGASLICGIATHWAATLPELRPAPALLAWAAAIGLLLAGAWRLAAPRPAIGLAALRAARWELVAVLALTLLALALRAYALARIPQNFGGDEGEMGMNARAILQGLVDDPFATGWLGHPNMWFFLQALALRLFGDTVFGLRMLSALIGTATVPALYAFARPLYGRPAALIAAALLATYHFHIHFSRLAANNIVDPLAALIAFTAFLHGLRTRSPLSFALAGVVLGLAQHFYMGSRLAPLVVAAALLHQLIFERELLWSLRWHVALMALGFLLGFGPLLTYFLNHPRDYTARLDMVGVFQTGWFDQERAGGQSAGQILLGQAIRSFGAWTWQPDRSAWYDPKIPLLDGASAPLFLLGLGLVVASARRVEAAMLLAWMAGTAVLGGLLLVNSPETPRYVTSAPLACLFIALAIAELAVLLRQLARLPRPVVWSLAGAATLLLALWNLDFYFDRYTPRNTYGWFNTEIGTTLGNYLRTQPDPFVYFFGAPTMYYGNGTIRFLAPDVPGTDLLAPIGSPGELPELPAGRRPIFVFLNARAGELAVVQQRYPGGSTQQVRSSAGDSILMTIYTLDR